MIKAAIFDMDGTIADSEPIHFRAESEVFAEVGIQIDRETMLTRFAGTGSGFIFPTLFKENNIDLDPKPYIKKKHILTSKYLQTMELGTIPGALEFLQKCKDANLKIALASGTSMENILVTLKRLNLETAFDSVNSAKDAGVPKPDPAVFIQAAKNLNIAPENCIVFEDAISGIKAAKTAGMLSVALTTSVKREKLLEQNPDLIIENFLDLEISDLPQ